jgi:hypothetical protein
MVTLVRQEPPVKPAQLVTTVKPAQPVTTVKPDQPVTTVKPVKSAQQEQQVLQELLGP